MSLNSGSLDQALVNTILKGLVMSGSLDLQTYNLLVNDGVAKTLSPSELAILDGLLPTQAELNFVDGVTSAIQTQIDGKQAVVSGVDNTEIGYLDGVTSALQTQINTINAQNGIGSSNKLWKNGGLPFVYGSTSTIRGWGASPDFLFTFSATTSVDVGHYFELEPTRDGLSLYISGFRLIIDTADASNYMGTVDIIGFDASGNAIVYDNGATTYNSAGIKEVTFTPVDVSSYNSLALKFRPVLATSTNLRFSPPQIQYYYA